MPTKNIVPRTGSEGKIGTISKRWGEGNFDTIDISGSSRFGSELTDTHVFTGSFHQTGSGATSYFKDTIDIEGNLTASGHVSASQAIATTLRGANLHVGEFAEDHNWATGVHIKQAGTAYNDGIMLEDGTFPDGWFLYKAGQSLHMSGASQQKIKAGPDFDTLAGWGGNLLVFGDDYTTEYLGFGIMSQSSGLGLPTITGGGIGTTDAGLAFRTANTGVETVQMFIDKTGSVGVGTTAPDHTLTVIGDISASVNVSASAFYGDGQHLDNVGGNLQDVTDLGNTTTNSITTSGYHFGTSDGKIYDDDGEFRIRVLTTPGSPFEIRSGADVTYDNEIVCFMERPSDDERTNVLFGSGLNTLQAERQLEVISRDRLDSSYGVMFGTNEPAKFMNLEIRTAHDDSYSALDLTTNTAASSLQTSDYFGEADISGFRLRYMEDDAVFKIQSGNGATVADRLVIDRDTGEVSASAFVGDGAGITGVTADTIDVNPNINDFDMNIVYSEGNLGTKSLYGDVDLKFNPSTNKLTLGGELSADSIQVEGQVYNSGEDKGTETADFTIDWDEGMTQEVILDSPGAATTLTASFDNVKPYATYQLIHKIGKDNMAIYFDESIYWPGGTRPTLSTTSGSIDVLTFTTDGNSPNPNIYGVAQYNFSASVG